MKKATTDLLEIAYLESGEQHNEVIVFLHGWPDDATTWLSVRGHFPGYRTIIPFWRGFGETRFLSTETLRTGNPARLAMDIIALLDAINVKEFVVIGHDWGANVGEALAVGWPERVMKLAQLSTPSRLGGLKTPPFAHARLEWYHWFMATKRGADTVHNDPVGFGKIMWDTWSPEGWYTEETFTQVSKNWLNPDFVAVTLHSYRSRWDEWPVDPDTAELEAKIKATKSLSLPALFIGGEKDGVNPPWVSEKVGEKFTGPFERIILPGVGHFPQREAPEKVAGILQHFIHG